MDMNAIKFEDYKQYRALTYNTGEIAVFRPVFLNLFKFLDP
jgi:hypothetical protein